MSTTSLSRCENIENHKPCSGLMAKSLLEGLGVSSASNRKATLRNRLCVSFSSLATLALAGSAAVAAASNSRNEAATAVRAAQTIVTITNRERIKHKLPPLKVDRHCVSAITRHVSEMASLRYLSHQGRDGKSASERYRRFNAAGRGAGENVAYNAYGSGESFMRQWLRSPAHRANILSPVYKGVGVSVRASCVSRQGRRCYYYAGQCFSP